MVIDGFTVFGSWPGQPEDHPADELVEGLERYKLDRACTLSADSIFLDARMGNDATWEACQRDNRLVPIGAADPRIGGVEQVLECRERGIRLLALFPNSQGWTFDSVTAKAVLTQAIKAEMAVVIEAGRGGDPSRILTCVADSALPVILLDVSLPVLSEAMAVLNARQNTYLTTRLLTGGDTIEYLCQTVGAGSLLFTSRYPVSCFSSAFLTAKFATINDDDRNAIMGGNMARLLGIA
jgi:predicted TIM-barrel fold metal-dependent hydrolase